jgi:hypothetical protein
MNQLEDIQQVYKAIHARFFPSIFLSAITLSVRK